MGGKPALGTSLAGARHIVETPIGRDVVSFVDHISERIMTEPVVKQFVLASRPNGLPTRENFRLEEVPLPMLPQGGLLLRVLYLSLDPYMRGRMDDRKSYAKPVGLGEVMTGESVCEVMTSDQADYAVGDVVLAPTGWRTHATSAGGTLRKLDPAMAPITTGLGVLGMPGFTAYAGLNLIGKPKPSETSLLATPLLARAAEALAAAVEKGRGENRASRGQPCACENSIRLA